MPNFPAKTKRNKSGDMLARIAKTDLQKISQSASAAGRIENKYRMKQTKQTKQNYSLGELFYSALSHMGNQTIEILVKIRGFLVFLITAIVAGLLSLVIGALRRLSLASLNVQGAVSEPFISFFGGVYTLKRRVSRRKKNGAWAMMRAFSSACIKGIAGNRGVFKRALNYAVPTVSVIALVMLAGYYTNINFALGVEYKGMHLGYIEDDSVYDKVGSLIHNDIMRASVDDLIVKEITLPGEQKTVDAEAKLSVAIADPEDIINDRQLYSGMVKMASDDIFEAFGLYGDGVFYGAVESYDNINMFLESFKLEQQSENSDGTVELLNNIEFVPGLYSVEDSKTEDELIELLGSDVSGRVVYTVVDGDTPSGIAQKNGIPYSQLKALNPGIEKRLMPGDEVLISEVVPFLNVKIVKQIEYTEYIPFETKKTVDSAKLIGINTVLQEGVDGRVTVNAEVEYVDGVETSRTITGKSIVSEPVTERISEGIKPPEVVYISPEGELIGGDLIWPVNGGYISQGFKGAAHKGLDIPAPEGTDIYAAADGYVLVAESGYKGFGKCVIIDHGNGFRTLYGHCVELYVKPGEKVQQGQLIAGVGNTGKSQGNHLHFATIQDGEYKDPGKYIFKP